MPSPVRPTATVLALLVGFASAACAPGTPDDEGLLDEFTVDSEDALVAGPACPGAPVCTNTQARPQCLAASRELNFGYDGHQFVKVPALANYSFVTLVLKRLFARVDGSFQIELRQLQAGSSSMAGSTFVTAATLPGALIGRANAPVKFRFPAPVQLSPTADGKPGYVLLFSVTGGSSLTVGIACAEGSDALPGEGVTAGGRKLLKQAGNYVPQAWRTITRDVALAFGTDAGTYGSCTTTASATCDDGNLASGDGCSAACLVESGWSCAGLPSVCSNVDDCAGHGCLNGATCVDGVNSYTCSCAPGYSGPTCATNIDDCAPNPCQNGGSCTDGVAGFTCACATGWEGATCGTSSDDCAPNPCLNGGTCTDGVNSYTCACATGYTGTTCSACAAGYTLRGTTCEPTIWFESFAGTTGGSPGTQCTTGTSLLHSANVSGWSKSGTNAAHVTLRGAGNYALQLYDTNTLTLTTGVAANLAGRHYRLEFLSSPTVWAECGQTTPAGNTLLLEVLRTNGTVLASFTHGPGAWAGAQLFTAASYGYGGDGSGNVRVRVSDSTLDGRFAGAIDDVALSVCPAGTSGPACALTNQTITFAQPADAWTSDVNRTLAATASSGLAVSYASSTTPVCTVSGAVVTFVSIGTCTITASQAGNGTYAAAPDVVRSFPVGTVSATGGTESTINVGGLNYRVHKFTTTGQLFQVTKGGSAQYLAIGGGGAGGGGYNHCGGGGAGGVLEGNYTLNGNQNYLINVGAGGTPNGGNGGNSGFGSVSATGGGGGCGSAYGTGAAGGSGGGGCALNGQGGNGVSGQGYKGGTGSSANLGGSDSAAGGGGGAGGNGSPQGATGPFTNSPGSGGPGIQRDITGTMTWYAAGGSGAGYYGGSSANGIGGLSPGYNPNIGAATAGAANTGSGGGGGRANQTSVATSSTGGAGGSGIVVIRYRIP